MRDRFHRWADHKSFCSWRLTIGLRSLPRRLAKKIEDSPGRQAGDVSFDLLKGASNGGSGGEASEPDPEAMGPMNEVQVMNAEAAAAMIQPMPSTFEEEEEETGDAT